MLYELIFGGLPLQIYSVTPTMWLCNISLLMVGEILIRAQSQHWDFAQYSEFDDVMHLLPCKCHTLSKAWSVQFPCQDAVVQPRSDYRTLSPLVIFFQEPANLSDSVSWGITRNGLCRTTRKKSLENYCSNFRGKIFCLWLC